MPMLRFRALFCTLLILMLAASLPAAPPTFEVRFDPAVREEAFSGRVYVFLSERGEEPRKGPDWFNPEPFWAKDVSGWEPGETITLSFEDPEALVFPAEGLPESLAGYRVQAVARLNGWAREVGSGPGNGYSPARTIEAGDERVELVINKLVVEPPFQETKWGKLLKVKSEKLREFHERDVYLRGTVRLPASYYDHPNRRYPVIFTIPGFGGDHRKIGHGQLIDPVREPVMEDNAQGVEFIRVLLDPNFPWGHHVFADSANNGPVGTAFVEEFIPALDQQFRTILKPGARFLTGHSSGGWSSLWLQVSHPDTFGGTWSTAPDPVDFRDFQNINIYEPGENMWFDEEGDLRPLARMNGRVIAEYQTFDQMEQVLGHGGQLQSFEAVFGPRGENGEPVPLWSREDGSIHTEVAKAWMKYDINHLFKENWETLGPKLEGELHVFMGTEDTFYLEGATRNLKQTLEELGSDAVVEMVPEADHFDLVTPELTKRIRQGMVEAFLAEFPDWPSN